MAGERKGTPGNLTADDWVQAGYALLASDGMRALKIERLCEQVGATRGSFYWHFTDMKGYRAALVASWNAFLEQDRRSLAELEDLPPREATIKAMRELTGAVIGAIALFGFARSLPAAIVLGLGLALSSTAFGLQSLAESKQLNAPHGRLAFAVLLENNPRFVHYHKLYPARRLTRRWIALLGPTNSGKTHRSIEAMAAAEHAIYLSPLRLMALENQERIESMGVPCSLVTGEEEIIREGATHFCCTVEEFARFRHQHWDVVVVDEVQMMADPQRGWAWVDALVSAHTPKLMMTGPALIEPSLRTLCELCEDQLQVQRTKRLSTVEVAKHATTLERLEPGSLLVAFSRKLVLELKGMLESAGKSVSVVYGALSPEVRREQARLA